jgi:trehalose utilization protein
MAVRVTVWNEFFHENTEESVAAIYPGGIHMAIADFLKKDEDIIVRTATLQEPEHGLTEDVLLHTDVLIWWGHARHAEVADEVAGRVVKRVLDGMGLIVLHSGHMSKPFTKLMGTSCSLRWHEEAEKERIFIINPQHPIARGLPPYFEIPHEEMYGERFDIPAPDELVFLSWFQTGEVFRSGCCFTRGYGRIFYFQPGHETFPIYYHPQVQKVITNAVRWAAPNFEGLPVINGDWVPPLEKL